MTHAIFVFQLGKKDCRMNFVSLLSKEDRIESRILKVMLFWEFKL
jgi:hypothetical protein